jgi:hypothetical protein
MLLDLPPSAYHSPVYGPVFLFQTDRFITSDATGTLDGSSELRSLSWSNHLLGTPNTILPSFATHCIADTRFGARTRAYVMHNARAFSLPLLHEASLAFAPFFSATPLSRFRGVVNTPPDLEVNMMFLGQHFVVERHREALLYSWVVAKWGATGMLGSAEKDAMWTELGGERTNDHLSAAWPERESRLQVAQHMHRAGIREPFLRAANSSQPRPQYSFGSSLLFCLPVISWIIDAR